VFQKRKVGKKEVRSKNSVGNKKLLTDKKVKGKSTLRLLRKRVNNNAHSNVENLR